MGKHFADRGPDGPSADKVQGTQRAVGFEPYRGASASPYDVYDLEGPKKRAKGPRVGVIVLVVVLCLIAAVGVEGFFLYRSVNKVKSEASTVMGAADGLKGAIKAGDAASLAKVSSNVNVSAHNIQSELSGFEWTVASLVPVLGDDVRSVRTLGDVLVDLSDNALTPLASNSDVLNLSNLMHDGAVNVPVLQSLSSAVQQAGPVVVRSADTLEALPQPHISQVGDIIGKVRGKMSSASDGLEKLNLVLPYLPQMLGANGQTRNYLLVAQNNSELRSTGGFYGSWSLMTVTDGRIELGDSQILQNVYVPEEGRPDVTDAEVEVFGAHVRDNPGSTGYLYDFTRAGSVAAQYWQTLEGDHIDGTVAVDPVFLQGLLALTGGITTSNGTVVDGSNAASVLLSDAYWDMSSDATDAFFSEVASRSFGQLTGNLGKVDMIAFLDTLNKSSAEGRVQAWMANAEEEKAIVELGMSGNFGSDATKPVAGVYLNNQSFSKLDWYLKVDNSIGPATKNADGTTSYQVTTSLTNELDPGSASNAPQYVLGSNSAFDKTHIVEGTYLVAPAGGSISNVSVSNGEEVRDFSYTGINVWYSRLEIPMEDTVSLTYTVTVPATAVEPLKIHLTPTAQVAAGW